MRFAEKREIPVYRTYSHNERYGLLCAGEVSKEGVANDTLRSKYPFYCMVLIVKGRGRYEDETGYKAELKEGTVLQRLPDRKHSVKILPDSRWHELFIGFGVMDFSGEKRAGPGHSGDFWKADLMHPRRNRTLDCLEELSLPLRDTPCFSLAGGEEILADKIRDFSHKLKGAEPESLPLLAGEVLGIFSLFRQSQAHSPGREKDPLSSARIILEENLGNRIPVEELLRPLPLGYARLRERFREETGLSPGQYRIVRRIEKACSLLSAHGLSPGETAQELGYEDTSSFSRQFRRVMGLSPGEFARR